LWQARRVSEHKERIVVHGKGITTQFFFLYPQYTIPHLFQADDTVLATSNKLYSAVVQTEIYAIKAPVI
jgi:hypothetical protein